MPAAGYIVQFGDNVDAAAITHMLESKYGFNARNIFQAGIKGFVADLLPGTVAQLRCEPAVKDIEENSHVIS